ncbi:MEDS domain-containing protein [Actinomycetospora aeridis]|uniref:Uncharacterized protein n=1 Tax=Actinomycetospora aeridis TaxID=3129231 RepID=A0ABU8NEF1_9PSEU
MTRGPGGRGEGLRHLGLLFDGPDDLVAGALPVLREALDGGDDVVVAADRATVRRLREGLGADAERIAFPVPAAVVRPAAPEFVHSVRDWVRPDRRTTVLGRYPATMPPRECRFGEDALNAVFGDLPLTLICCARRDLPPDLLEVVRRAHPRLATPVGDTGNPDYRAPATSSPTPAALWGEVAERVGVGGTADLAELRRCVADVAARAGLEGDAVRAAVLAVHEAAVLAVRRGDPAHADLTVEVRARPGHTLFCEVAGPRGVPAPEGLGAADTLAHVRPFCAGAHDDPALPAVRVLSTV